MRGLRKMDAFSLAQPLQNCGVEGGHRELGCAWLAPLLSSSWGFHLTIPGCQLEHQLFHQHCSWQQGDVGSQLACIFRLHVEVVQRGLVVAMCLFPASGGGWVWAFLLATCPAATQGCVPELRVSWGSLLPHLPVCFHAIHPTATGTYTLSFCLVPGTPRFLRNTCFIPQLIKTQPKRGTCAIAPSSRYTHTYTKADQRLRSFMAEMPGNGGQCARGPGVCTSALRSCFTYDARLWQIEVFLER